MGITDLLIYAMLATTTNSKKRDDDTFTCQSERVLHRMINRHALARSTNGKHHKKHILQQNIRTNIPKTNQQNQVHNVVK